jgi:hypothetical protein
MTAFSAAVQQQQYELAALRLLLGVVTAIERSAATREELITWLTVERP